jgi:hypothetical protein
MFPLAGSGRDTKDVQARNTKKQPDANPVCCRMHHFLSRDLTIIVI